MKILLVLDWRSVHYDEKPIPVRKLSALFGKFRYASDGTVLYFTWYGTVWYGTDTMSVFEMPTRVTRVISRRMRTNVLELCSPERSE